MSGKTDFHVDISKFPRGEEKIPRKFHLILPKFHLIPPKFYFTPTWEIKKYPRGDLRFSTWIFEKGEDRTNFPVKICY